MAKNSIGLIELTSIAAGYQACDAMLKAADVDLVLSRSICSGKYMVMVRGDVAAVQAAVSAGIAGGALFGDRFVRDSEPARGGFPGDRRHRRRWRRWKRWASWNRSRWRR